MANLYEETPDWLIERLNRTAIQPSLFQPPEAEPTAQDSRATAPVERVVATGAPLPSEGWATPPIALATMPETPTTVVVDHDDEVDDHRQGTRFGRARRRSGHAKPKPMIEVLLQLTSRARSFRSPDGRFHAEAPVGERFEVYGLKSAEFRDWLIAEYVVRELRPPSEMGRPPRGRHAPRLGPGLTLRFPRSSFASAATSMPRAKDEIYFLDLGDAGGRAVEIRASGWTVVDRPRVHFRRPDGLLPLPIPSHDGSSISCGPTSISPNKVSTYGRVADGGRFGRSVRTPCWWSTANMARPRAHWRGSFAS